MMYKIIWNMSESVAINKKNYLEISIKGGQRSNSSDCRTDYKQYGLDYVVTSV